MSARVINMRRCLQVAHRWGPVLLWMAIIFYLSSRPALPAAPSLVRSSRDLTLLHGVGHLGEYAVLLALLYRALIGGRGPERAEANSGRDESPEPGISSAVGARLPFDAHRPLKRSLGIALLFALSDEVHQGLVPGRKAEVGDFALDALGAGLALVLIGGWRVYIDNIERRRRASKGRRAR